MRKNLRMIAGIILHPVRLLIAWYMRSTYENIIRRNLRERWHWKNYERMHHMSTIAKTAYTKSALLNNLDYVPGLDEQSPMSLY